MHVHCISVSEHIWVGGVGPRGVGELPAGGIRASQGTFSSFIMFIKDNRYMGDITSPFSVLQINNLSHFEIFKLQKK